MASSFDASRARLKGPDFFPRFNPPAADRALTDHHFAPQVELVVVERGGQRRAFLSRELSHPHMAQGTLGGEPYLVSF